MDACTGDLRVLPYDIILGILDHLSPADRISMCLANKYLWNAETNKRWMDSFRRNRSPEPSWDPPRSMSTQWRPPAQGGLLQLLAGLERDAPGTIHVCPNCKVIHQGQYARSSLQDVQLISTKGLSHLYDLSLSHLYSYGISRLDSRSLCAASGSSDWEVRVVFLDWGVRDFLLDRPPRSFPIAEKMEFHTTYEAGIFACHRVTRVLLDPSVVLALASVKGSVVLALRTCPFIICRHFAIQDLDITNVYSTIYCNRGNRWGRINISRGWALPFDAENNRAVQSGRVERDGWFVCSKCGTSGEVTKHFHGDRGVEIVLDVFYRPEHLSGWWDRIGPAFAMPLSDDLNLMHLGWNFCAPLLVPGASGISDPSIGAVEQELQETCLSGAFSLQG